MKANGLHRVPRRELRTTARKTVVLIALLALSRKFVSRSSPQQR
jgi:hypothetical protein